ncbi:MAG: S-layer family protein, partial [Planctomycetaceae bacterium]|nr:S-layer family protein [Planctomycetaceae bacterium]
NTGGGNVTLAANGDTVDDDLILQANVEAVGGTGNITLQAGDSIDLQGLNSVLAAGAGNITLQAGTNFNHGNITTGLTNGTNAGSIRMVGGTTIGSGAGLVTLEAPGDIALSIVTADVDSADAIGNLVITADFDGVETGLSNSMGAISDNLTGDAANLIGIDATLSAATGIGHTDDLQTALVTVTATNTTSGKIQLNEVGGALSLTQVTNEDADIVISTVDGDLTAAGAITVVTGSGDIRLSANDFDDSGNGTLTIQAAVTTPDGAIELTSAAHDVKLDAAAAVGTTTGKVTVTAASGPDDGKIVMADGATISGDLVELTAQGDITLGSVSATSSSDTAVVISAQNGGGIIDADNSTGPDITATNGRLVITADNGIGDADALEISVKSLDLQVLQPLSSGKVQITADQSLDVVQAVQSGTGLMDLTVNGTLTILTTASATPNVSTTSGALNLTATGVNGRIVVNGDVATTTGPIDLNAAQDVDVSGTVTSTGGAINIESGTGTDVSGTVSTGTGKVDISTTTSFVLQDGGKISTTGAAGIITIGAGTTATVDGNIQSGDAAINVTSQDQLSLGSTGSISTAAGAIHLQSAIDTVALDASVTSTDGLIDIQAGQDITLGAMDVIHSDNDAVTLDANNDILINGEVSSIGAKVTLLAMEDIEVTSTGVVETDSGEISLETTNGDIAVDGRVETQSDKIDINAGQDVTQASTGSVLSDSGEVVITAGRDVKLSGTNETTSGPMDITAANDLTLTSTGKIATDSATIDLTATTGTIELQQSVSSTSAAITLDAGTDVVMTSNGSVGTSAQIDVDAGNDITMSDGATIISSGKEVILTAVGDITVGRISGTPQVSITSTSGAIIDGGDTGGADLTAAQLLLRAATGIGSTNALETNTVLIAASNSTSGSIQVSNNTGLNDTLVIGEVPIPEGGTLKGITNNGTGTGGISVTNAGALTVNSRITDLNSGGITLVTTGVDNDLTINAAVQASNDQFSGGEVQLTTTGDLVIVDTGEVDDVRGRTVTGNATGNVVFDETSGVKIRSSTGAVVSPTPLLLNVVTPQVSGEGVATVTFDFGHVGAENFYVIVLWDPAFFDRTGLSPAILDGQPIFGIFNSNGIPPATTADFPPEFLAAFQTLVARANAVGPVPPGAVIDGYDQFALAKMFMEEFAGQGSFSTTHTYLANPSKSVPYNPAEEIPITVLLLDDGNITLTSGGTDLGQADETSLAEVPGSGLQGASFVFDLSIEVPQLEAPRSSTVESATITTTTLVERQDTEETQALIDSDSYSEQRTVILEKIAPDGSPARLPNGELLRREYFGSEGQDLLDDLPDLFDRLKEGHWRIYLKQGADAQPQLLRDIELRDGKPAGDDAGTQDRPPTSETEAAP